ncbi:MAG: EAL domain-containing protein [Gemmatimonadaceae bacterium]|nr:EAL domain-containing protein [Gemmatimonadaceae bacterium]
MSFGPALSRSGIHTDSISAHDLIAREETIFQRELLNRATQVRFRLVVLELAVGIVDFAFNVLPGPWQFLVVDSVLLLLVNELVRSWNRRGATNERHLLGMQVLDAIMFGLIIASFGHEGHLVIPFLVLTVAGYAMGHPRAARRQLVLSCLLYPIAHLMGERMFSPSFSVVHILLETFLMGAISWLAMQTPIRYVFRVRRARRALAALAEGDWSVRLPTRALDDVGFLGVSFNVTAEQLGAAVRALEDEVEERARAEESMRVARHEATQMAERMSAVAQAAAGVLATDSARALRDVLRRACADVLHLQRFAIILVDRRAGTIRVLGDSNGDDVSRPLPTRGALRRVIDERQSCISDEPFDGADGGAPTAPGTMMRTPIIVGNDVVGVLAVSGADAYGTADVAVFEALAALAATALRNILLVEELRSSREALSHQAHHDGLTGLANRRRFRARVSQSLEREGTQRVALLALDLDGFKEVNDTLGHAAGDRVLQTVSDRLLNATRGSDLVARLGGDEFAVLLEHVPDDAQAVVVADRILRSVSQPITIGDRLVGIGTSIGIAFGHTEARTDEAGALANPQERHRDLVDVLLHEADVALYRAKTAGKSCWVIFESSMHEEERSRRQLEGELREAVASGELQLLFQPICDIERGALRGVEATARWDHPRRGTVAPAVWQPLAEESGLVVDIGEWLLERACTAVAQWPNVAGDRVGEERPISLTLKVSIRQLQSAVFATTVQRILATSGLPASSLLLEVTEEALTRASAAARDQMQRLHNMGIRFIVDDFGMGASSLGYLQGLAVDMLKIDRSFVQGVARGGSQTALARTILALGRALNLATIAEGVDTEAQRVALQSLGCELGQGTFYSRPVSEEAIVRMLEGERVGTA